MREFNESEFLIETEVPSGELIISRTDLKGNITFANETFAQISGYEVNELVGQSHNIVRHPDMPKVIFEEMWKQLKKEGKWEGVVKNLRKDRGFYWVHAIVSEVYKDGVLVEYKSLRTPISHQRKLQSQKMYDEMRNLCKENIRQVIYQN